MSEVILLDSLDGFIVSEDEWGQVQCNQYGTGLDEDYFEDMNYYGEEL